jgi:hypothetical protein
MVLVFKVDAYWIMGLNKFMIVVRFDLFFMNSICINPFHTITFSLIITPS